MEPQTPTAEIGYVPDSVPDMDHLVDSGFWRECGVTHWHLTVEDITTSANDRYSAERLRGIDLGREARPTADPRQALQWIGEQRIAALRRAQNPAAAARRAGLGSEADWAQRAEVTWHVLTTAPSTPAGGGIAISDGRSVDIFAVPMTARDCSRH